MGLGYFLKTINFKLHQLNQEGGFLRIASQLPRHSVFFSFIFFNAPFFTLFTSMAVFFYIQFLKVTFHLQLLQNIGYIPVFCSTSLSLSYLHPIVCTSHSATPILHPRPRTGNH